MCTSTTLCKCFGSVREDMSAAQTRARSAEAAADESRAAAEAEATAAALARAEARKATTEASRLGSDLTAAEAARDAARAAEAAALAECEALERKVRSTSGFNCAMWLAKMTLDAVQGPRFSVHCQPVHASSVPLWVNRSRAPPASSRGPSSSAWPWRSGLTNSEPPMPPPLPRQRGSGMKGRGCGLIWRRRRPGLPPPSEPSLSSTVSGTRRPWR